MVNVNKGDYFSEIEYSEFELDLQGDESMIPQTSSTNSGSLYNPDEVITGVWDEHIDELDAETAPTTEQVVPAEQNFPRRSLKEGCPLVNFLKRGGMPKHEYYVAMLIRALKKAIRKMGNVKEHPKGGVFRVLKSSKRAIGVWETFCEEMQPWKQFLFSASRTEDGPATDGKTKRKDCEAKFSSFNKSYVQHFYEDSWMRVAHFLFTEMIFSANPATLCHAMKFNCCEGKHSHVCDQKWSMLKRYTQSNIIEEVGLRPFFSH